MKNEERRAKKRKIQNKKAFRLRETPSCSVGEEGIKIPRFLRVLQQIELIADWIVPSAPSFSEVGTVCTAVIRCRIVVF